MTDLEDEVRNTLSSPPDYAPRDLDLSHIMVAGGRLRRRRQIVTGAAAVVAVVALFLGGAQVFGQAAPQPVNPPAATVAPSPSTPAPKIADNSNGLKGPLGDVIGTGVRTHKGLELVIFGVSGITIGTENSYGFALGERLASGDVTEWTSINEDPAVAKNTAPGFHAIQKAVGMQDSDAMPAFGYYVGTPAKITAKCRNKTVIAKTAVWTYDKSVTVFWFDLADVPVDSTLDRPHAYNAAGIELPAGNNKIHGII